MNMVEHLDLHADWLERQADKEDAREERRADAYREAWDNCLKHRSIDAETGMKYMPKLIDVINEATCQTDESIFRALMQAVVTGAANGQPEAVSALAKVKDFFVAWRLEMKE